MLNIKFWYMYRDSSNYKNHGYVIFANPSGLSLEVVEKRIRHSLIDGTFFYPGLFGMPELFFEDIGLDDPSWHEFVSLEYTTRCSDELYSLDGFQIVNVNQL